MAPYLAVGFIVSMVALFIIFLRWSEDRATRFWQSEAGQRTIDRHMPGGL